ncbi:DNA topoisomerase IB [Pacificimonas sp. WHA3]|uniref:DNA topoisomerase IB n=1 Tax=Pacificimonas pallii TaxID=2827236 RepID=A0ABS6SDG5_9SPHN|nr:DNA topoisomerase IB [Pacificimonas pallii]MBV7256454.1 DNA topoisomerase IB [Pacificimonas pallii]
MRAGFPSQLRYVDDAQPGISRRWRYKRWHYFDPHGERIARQRDINRLNGLAVPPAYENVWYCQWPDGHLQATGRDAKGRKQYRYHPEFRALREADKFSRTVEFGRALPVLREQVEADLRRRNLSRERVLAAMVRLLDAGRIRVGNDDYARRNNTKGATTLTDEDVDVRGDRLYLEYTAKGGKARKLHVDDGSLARLARRCQDLPGQHLFAWEGDDGKGHRVSSDEVNAYIRAATQSDFTAKHFRTWHASAIAFRQIVRSGGDLTLKDMLAPVAKELGNTIAISRKSYVHPALIEYAKNHASTDVAGLKLPPATAYLRPHERGLIDFLARI